MSNILILLITCNESKKQFIGYTTNLKQYIKNFKKMCRRAKTNNNCDGRLNFATPEYYFSQNINIEKLEEIKDKNNLQKKRNIYINYYKTVNSKKYNIP